MNRALEFAFVAALLSMSAGCAARAVRYARYWLRTPRQRLAFAGDHAPPRGRWRTLATYWAAPALDFHRVHRPRWTCGYLCYHVAIVSLVASYAMAALLYVARRGPLDVAVLLRHVVGYSEPGHAAFLFGSAADRVVGATWVDVGLATLGNALLWIFGRRTREKRLVRVLITLIIWSEIIGRLASSALAVDIHILAASIFAAALPWLYTSHMVFFPVVLVAGFQKRRHRLCA